MKNILGYNSFNEKLKPSQFREYMKVWDESPELRDRYKDIFEKYKSKYDGDKNSYRIFLPLIEDVKVSDLEKSITDLLDKNGWEVIDYAAGMGRFKGAKNPKRIGQVLTSLERNSKDEEEKTHIKLLMKQFVEDTNRKQGSSSKYLVCISRHPYDIAGADTDRKWDNCMTMGSGGNVHYLIHDVREGSLVSYLINKDDKNIQDPIANCAIKPYINGEDPSDIILVKDSKTYPQPYPDFERTVTTFLGEINGDRKGIYCLNSKLYNDNRLNNKIVNIDELNPETITKIAKVYGIKKLIINDDMSVDVKGSVDLSGKMLTKLPLIFNRVWGSFTVADNQLKSLEGCPSIVDGDFFAYGNQLMSLKGGPTKVGGEYSVSGNYLNSINGIASEIGSHLDVSFNSKISSLKKSDVDSKIGGMFINRSSTEQSYSDSSESKSFKNIDNFDNFKG